jgi:CBS domain-containing protein
LGLFDGRRDILQSACDATWRQSESDATLQEAAQAMTALIVDPLMVLKDDEPVGMITDRYVTVRATANGFDSRQTRVWCARTSGFICESETHSIQQAVNLMTIHWLRQLPILNRERELVGIVLLTDLFHAIDDVCLAGST